MKTIVRLTESELNTIIENAARKLAYDKLRNRTIREDVLGNNWHEAENDNAFNNYEPFEDQIDGYEAEDEFRNQHDWGTQGEDEFDPTFYEDPDQYRDDVVGGNYDLSDGDLYRGMY